jgi:hypothetical protein
VRPKSTIAILAVDLSLMLRPEEIVGIAARMVAVAIKTNRAMEAAMISAGTTITAETTQAPQ